MRRTLLILATTMSLITMSYAAFAQSPITLDTLLGQPGMSQQLNNLQPRGTAANNVTGIPTSQNADALNAEDIGAREDLLLQSTGQAPQPESVVQKYFRIMTGQLLEVYGAKEFSQRQDSQLLFFNTVGKNYQLAPGDVIRVTIRGLTQSNQNYKIDREGNLIIDNLAPLGVSGLTIRQVEEILLDTLQYDDASASVFVSLETARLITVQVSGAVNDPRTLAVPAYTPLSRIIAYAGGIKPNGSLRKIILSTGGGTVSEVDFYDLLRNPAGANDPLVSAASRIFVPNQGATVGAYGFVAQPAIYELAPGATEISVKELLELSGTSILPPGLVLEGKYFDESGVSKTRVISIQDTVKAGEVLNLRFVETRLQEAITVVGAVLEEYVVAVSEPVKVQELLKLGAVLKRDARTDFSMVIAKDGSVRSINLAQALQNDVETIPVGATLVVFDQQSYRDLVSADPNSTDNPLVAAVSQAEVAELYLNGTRLAFIPPNQIGGFASTIRSYYRITPQTNLELAIIEDENGEARSVSLRDLLLGAEPFVLRPGTKIHLFESTFLTNFVDSIDAKPEMATSAQLPMTRPQTTRLEGQGQNSGRFETPFPAQEDPAEESVVAYGKATMARLLARANVVRVKLDEKLLAILPSSNTKTISSIFDVLGIENTTSELSDFVLVETLTEEGRPKSVARSLSVDFTSELPPAQSVVFWRKAAFNKVLASTDRESLDRFKSVGIAVYVDYKLTSIVSPSALIRTSSNLSNLLTSQSVYPLFTIAKSFTADESRWISSTQKTADLLSFNKQSIADKMEIYLFSRGLIETLLNDGDNTQQERIVEAASVLPDENATQGGSIDIADQLSSTVTGKPSSESTSVASSNLQNDASLLTSFSRFVGGAVQKPGRYPVAGTVSINQLIEVAGGTLEDADTSNVSVQYLSVSNGSLVKGESRKIDMRTLSGSNYPLKGRYFIDVPALINEVATGVITLSGEVMKPGQYVFSRDDTLHDIIKRAGGLSPVAYPLGAVFSRASLKDAEREYNDLLATQLEQAVLQVASSENTNAKEQISAVLGYARQLRAQDPAGRLSVNVTLENPQAPVFLENGDTLTIPKRPAHVSILGAVNRDTIASYAPEKSLSAYLASSGGATRLADLKRAYLLLPSGESTPLSRNTLIPAGSAIVVPPKTDRLTVLGLTDLVSRVMGNIATSVLAINNVR